MESPRMAYGFGFAGQHAGKPSFSSNWFAWSTAVLDFLAVFILHCCHRSAFNVILVLRDFEHFGRTGFHAFAAAVAFVCVYYDEVVA